ncbi:dual specificity protein phosphatase 23 isoform X1 [Columba livia]|uniref:dual specificity protein phosphatase 23 isoform X1 n=1 Tax=Columba livia TaxID=8932 RepID=UPI0031BA7617
MGATEPPNFSWVSEGRLAGLAMPREPGHYRFLLGQGVRHLVSLSERPPPHHGCCPAIRLHRLRVPDFTPPTPGQIRSFLRLVEEANGQGEQWRGRRGGVSVASASTETVAMGCWGRRSKPQVLLSVPSTLNNSPVAFLQDCPCVTGGRLSWFNPSWRCSHAAAHSLQ